MSRMRTFAGRNPGGGQAEPETNRQDGRKVKPAKREVVLVPETPTEAIERLFGEKLYPVEFGARSLLVALWPLGPDLALQRAVEIGAAAQEGMRRAGRPLSSEGMNALGVPRPADCPEWLMTWPACIVLFDAARAETLIRGFRTRAALPWTATEGPFWMIARKAGREKEIVGCRNFR